MDKPELVLQRTFDAPRELVFKIWTDPAYVARWWGVEGCTIVTCELDVRPSGTFRIDMKTQDGNVYVNRGIYVDVRPNEYISYRDVRDPADLPGPIPSGFHSTTFEDAWGKTLVTLTSRFDSVADRDLMARLGVIGGITQSFDRLERLIQTLNSAVQTKETFQ
ncbi:MAG TPA: SRPBCC domain-containing protein [Candidatus Baltobacteraceae bacterium]|nr:SRPBCC domain-containing protein [Candidatus Baltobacteraceae bacterium]